VEGIKQNFTCKYVSCIFVLLLVHTMKNCRESEVQLHSLTHSPWSRCRYAVSFIPKHCGQELPWAPEPIWTVWERKNVMSLSGIEPQFLDLTVRSFTTPSFILLCTHGWTMVWRHYSVPVTCPAKLQTSFKVRSRHCRSAERLGRSVEKYKCVPAANWILTVKFIMQQIKHWYAPILQYSVVLRRKFNDAYC
jgi:hypothetical protein